MAFTKEHQGTKLLTNVNQMIYPYIDDDHVREPRWVEGWIFLHEVDDGDQVEIKVQTYDPVGQLLRTYGIQILSGVQEPIPVYHLGSVVTRWMKVEIKQNLAPVSYKNINYVFHEVS